MSDVTNRTEADGTRRGKVGHSQRGRIVGSVRPGPARPTADALSETGVLRLLNECAAPERSPERVASSVAVRQDLPADFVASSAGVEAAIACPRCGHGLSSENTICPRCRTRLATSSKAWQAVYRAAARALAAR